MDTNVLHNISYGMYVVASSKGDSLNAQIANALVQVTNQPARIAVSISKKNLTHEFITNSLYFSASILEEATPLNFIGKFGFKSGRNIDKFKDTNFKRLSSGCPVVLDNMLCYFEAKVINQLDCGTHTVFFGELAESEILKAGRPMTYDYYHNVKRGSTPKTAPTFIKEEVLKEGTKTMQKYRCSVCNYIYDPLAGDPDNGVTPGTTFDKLPDNWVCPVCGADKSQFIKEG